MPNGAPAQGVPVTLAGNGSALKGGSTRADGIGTFYNKPAGITYGISVSLRPNRCPGGFLLSGFGEGQGRSCPVRTTLLVTYGLLDAALLEAVPARAKSGIQGAYRYNWNPVGSPATG